MITARHLPQNLFSWSLAYVLPCLDLQFCATGSFSYSSLAHVARETQQARRTQRASLHIYSENFLQHNRLGAHWHPLESWLVTICYSTQTCSQPLLTFRILVRKYIFIILKTLQNRFRIELHQQISSISAETKLQFEAFSSSAFAYLTVAVSVCLKKWCLSVII